MGAPPYLEKAWGSPEGVSPLGPSLAGRVWVGRSVGGSTLKKRAHPPQGIRSNMSADTSALMYISYPDLTFLIAHMYFDRLCQNIGITV
ncbi:hypothetical protein PCURB6_40090 [Paenibacillus curdlanolyticus]|nr:hypothetical protein PCURB6_40090 [Paenibacillus curdlanolyticus]